MKLNGSLNSKFAALLGGCALLMLSSAQAKQGATDPIPGTSKGATNSGGGGGGGGSNSNKPNNTVVSSTIPSASSTTPQQPVAAQLTFTAAAEVNGVIPVCTGAYRIDPYYPTLSLMTVNVQCDSLNLPDGSEVYLTVNGTNGTLYPFTSNVIPILAGSGVGSYSVYVTPGTTITSVLVCDASGAIISAGQ